MTIRTLTIVKQALLSVPFSAALLFSAEGTVPERHSDGDHVRFAGQAAVVSNGDANRIVDAAGSAPPKQLSTAMAKAVEELRYRAERNESGATVAVNPAQDYGIEFTGEGIQLHPGETDVEIGLLLQHYGRSVMRKMAPVAPRASGPRVEFDRGDLVEWYVNRPAGLEQGFTVNERFGEGHGPLRFEMAVQGPARPKLSPDGDAIKLLAENDRVRLRYSGLRAWDADGRDLPARLEAEENRIALLVDDGGARYPITIDPVILNENAKLTASDGVTDDRFGISVAIDGNTIVVGASLDRCSGPGIRCGSAYVFEKPVGGWSGGLTEAAKLVAGDAAPLDQFGISVSISGDTIAVGARFDQCVAGVDCGAAYVFVKPVGGWSGTITHSAKLVASDRDLSDIFGSSVSISGDTVVAGSNRDDCVSGVDCGSAYVFVKPVPGWAGELVEIAKLAASDAAANDRFGLAVQISDDTILASSTLRDCAAGGNCGAAYVFVKPSGGWSGVLNQDSKLLASDAAQGDELGFELSIKGDLVIAGAVGDDCAAGNDCGSAYVFEKPLAGWAGNVMESAKLLATDAAVGDGFGWSTAITGDYVVVGAYQDDTAAGGLNAGSAYLFRKPAGGWSGTVNEIARLEASDGVASDLFGFDLAVSGGTAVVSAEFGEGAAADTGAAYVFELPLYEAGPEVTDVIAEPNPVAVNSPVGGVTLTATADDTNTGGSDILSVEYSIDTAPFAPMAASDGGFDEIIEGATAQIGPFATTGIREICVRATDARGNIGQDSEDCILLPVYDPSGGFVTGGGSVESPAAADLLGGTTGPARFGFVSKYLPGRTQPDGNLEFRFKAGDIQFKSTSMEWLVVTGQPRAIFRGEGTLNSDTTCKFEVDAWDESFNGGSAQNEDAFGLKIFACGPGIDRYTLAPTPLSSGSIKIHK